jgi:AcrR family transcriptional regulator
MADMAVTTPARERTRHEIVRQAMALFQAKGYNATSLQDIATAAGCSKATVLYHFNGKPAVLAAVLEPAAADLAELTATAAGMSRAEAQEYAIRRFTDLAVAHRGVVDVANGMRMTDYMAGSDDELERSLARFAVNGLFGECRHPEGRTDDELRTLCDVAIRRLLLLT